MKISDFIVILALLGLLIPGYFALSINHHKNVPCRKTDYSYSLLTLSWIGQFCSESTCDPTWRDNWNGTSFTVHGYWPNSADPAYLTCLRKDGYDKYCYSDLTFGQNNLRDLTPTLNNIWPQVGPKKAFWQYQWDKHGTCYLNITKDRFNPENLEDDEIFYRYFKQVIDKYDSLPVGDIHKFVFASKDEFAQELGLQTDQFMAICGNDSELNEIRICYSLAEPGQQQIISCGKMPKECSYPMSLKRK